MLMTCDTKLFIIRKFAEKWNKFNQPGAVGINVEKRKLLIVEDFKTNREILSRLIAANGYDYDTAEDGRQALEKLRGGAFDLVLLDIIMPEMDGYEVLSILKADEKLRGIPVIMITALDLIESAVRCIEMGAEDYLPKPYDPVLLRARISACLERKRLLDQEAEYRKKIEEHNMRLEERVRQQVEEITERWRAEEKMLKAKLHAEEETRLKDQFVSLVSHDLRSPLSSIIGLLRMMATDTVDPLSETQKELVSRMISASQGLVNMIDQLLNISRLKTGKIIPAPKKFTVRDMTHEVMESVQHLASEKMIKMENRVPQEIKLFADWDLYYQVIQNLLSNSIKFCRQGDTITVYAPDVNGGVIAVKDSGVGISPRILADIFKHEVKTTTVGTSGEKGTGLGLPFCYDIMKAHEGDLTVETRPGEGTTFFVSLPVTKGRALVVDAQKTVRHIFRNYMEKLGADVVEAGSGEDAIEIIKSNQLALVITSIQLPRMDGFELISFVRNNPQTSTTPIIVATATADIATREKAFNCGASDFVMKPIMDEDFIPRVRRFLN